MQPLCHSGHCRNLGDARMWSRPLVSTDSLSRHVIKQCNHHCDGIIIAMPRRHLAGKAEVLESALLFVDRGLRCAWVGLPVQAARPSLTGLAALAGSGGCGFKGHRLQLGSPRSAPRSRKVQARGEDSKGEAFFFFSSCRSSFRAAVTCQQQQRFSQHSSPACNYLSAA